MSRGTARLLPLVLRATCQPPSIQLGEIGLQTRGANGCRPRLLDAFQPSLRAFASNSDDAAKGPVKSDLSLSLKELLPIIQLQQDLKHEAELHHVISKQKLLNLILSRGAAGDEKAAENLSAKLHEVGVAVRDGEDVYLRPKEILEELLPDGSTVKYLETKLQKINAELQAFDKVQVDAERKTRRLLQTGCVFLATQLVVFWRLTFYELSWDVMEPIAYLLSVFYTLVAYTYFLFTKGHIFDLKPFQDSSVAYFTAKSLKLGGELQQDKVAGLVDELSGKVQLDLESYHVLVQARQRYEQRLKLALLLGKDTPSRAA